MSLLKPAKNYAAFLKAGILGFQGSGKTYTASEMAIGLCQHIKSDKAAFFDTEAGSDYMIPKFKDSGIELFSHKGRAFKDLCDIVRECETEGYPVLIIDSISHVWREIQDSYKKRVKRNSLYMMDWGILKGQWAEFTDLYLNSKVHIIMLGRAGYEYDQEESETGKKELIKTGTKMKVEGEMGYEPSLLIEMEGIKTGKKIINRAHIIKDRTDNMNGKSIDFPKFKDFMPIINFLNIGGEHIGFDASRNSEELFQNPEWSYEERKRKHSILIEQLHEILVLQGLSGTGAQAQKDRTELLIKFFGTSSKTHIEEKLSLKELEEAITGIRANFAPKEEPKVVEIKPSPEKIEEKPATELQPEPALKKEIKNYAPPATPKPLPPPSEAKGDAFQKYRDKYSKGGSDGNSKT